MSKEKHPSITLTRRLGGIRLTDENNVSVTLDEKESTWLCKWLNEHGFNSY